MATKITGSAFDALKDGVDKINTESVRERYRQGDFPRSNGVVDLDKRYRWDLFYAMDPKVRYALYDAVPGITDAHIYTALKMIIEPLGQGMPNN